MTALPRLLFAAAPLLALVLLIVQLATLRVTRALPPSPAPRPSLLLLAALAVFLATFQLLQSTTDPPLFLLDSARDLQLGRACAGGGPCSHGPWSSFLLMQGALWIRLLALASAQSLSVATLQSILAALHAAATTLLFVTTLRHLGRAAALPAGFLFIVLGRLVIHVPWLWNPEIAPLPLALFFAAAVELAISGGAWMAALGGLALALCADSHVACIALLPILVFAVITGARRPVWALLAALSCLAITLLLDSRAAWQINLAAVIAAHLLIPSLTLLAATVAAACVARRSTRAAAPRGRALALTFAALAVTLPTAAWATVKIPDADLRYGLICLPFLAAAAALVLSAIVAAPLVPLGSWLKGRARALVVNALALAVCLQMAPRLDRDWRHRRAYARGREWTVADMQIAAALLYQDGLSHAALRSRVQTIDAPLQLGLSVFEPMGRAAREPAADEALLFLRLQSGELPHPLPPRWRTAALSHDRVALVVPFHSQLDRAHLEACALLVQQPPHCASVNLFDPRAVTQVEFYPGIDQMVGRFGLEGVTGASNVSDVRLRMRFGLHPSRAAPVTFRPLPLPAPWELETTPGPTVSFIRDITPDGSPEANYWPPPVAEIPAGDTALDRVIDAALAGLDSPN